MTGRRWLKAVSDTQWRLSITDNTTGVAAVPTVYFAVSQDGQHIRVDTTGSFSTNGTLTGFVIDWGDGTTKTTGARAAEHVYASSGAYRLSVSLTDATGQSATRTQDLVVASGGTVTNRPPTAALRARTTAGSLTATLDASASTDLDGSIVKYVYTFGDNTPATTSTLNTVTHAYAASGSYSTTVTVTDDKGATSSASAIVTISLTSNAAAFAIDTVKPSAENTGAGMIRPYPTGTGGTLTGDQTVSGTTVLQNLTINGNLTITGGTPQILDCIIKGRVSAQGGSRALIENNEISGKPGETTSSSWLVNTSSSALTTVRFNTIFGAQAANATSVSQLINGIGLRNVLAEYNHIYQVVDCFDIDGVTLGSNGVDANAELRGNYAHGMVYFSPDAGHQPTTSLSITGTSLTYNGAHQRTDGVAGLQSSTHCDVIQLTGNAKGVYMHGNTLVADWSTTVGSLPLPTYTAPDGTKTIFLNQLSVIMANSVIGMRFWNNWCDGGQECLNLNDTAAGHGIDFRLNKFGRGMAPYGLSNTAPVVATTSNPSNPAGSSYAVYTFHEGTSLHNTFEDNGAELGASVRGGYTPATRAALVAGDYVPDVYTAGLLPGWKREWMTAVDVGSAGVRTGVVSSVSWPMFVPTSNTVYENIWFKVPVWGGSATNVTFRNCSFGGGGIPNLIDTTDPTYQAPVGGSIDFACVDFTQSASASATNNTDGNFLLEDCEILPISTNDSVNGIRGCGYTMRRTSILNCVDGADIWTSASSGAGALHVRWEGCLVDDLAYFNTTGNHSDNRTHNDCAQIAGGSGATFIGCALYALAWPAAASGSDKAPLYPVAGNALTVTSNVGPVTGINFSKGFIDGGTHEFIAIVTSNAATHTNLGTISDTKIGSQNKGTAIQISTYMTLTLTNVTKASDGSAVPISIGES